MNCHCPVCNGKSYPVWKEKKHRVFRCKKCRVAFLHPFPHSPESVYGREYFERWYIRCYGARKAYTENLFSAVEQYAGKRGKLLDVGCGAGILLDVASQRGWQVCGHDISPFAAYYCREKGFDVHDEFLPELNLPENSFDLITMFDVIAHLAEPVSYIQSCKRLLKPGGILAIKTPRHSPSLFFLASLLSFTGKSRTLLHVPAQIYHFSPGTMKYIADTALLSFIGGIRVPEFRFPPKDISSVISNCLKILSFEGSTLYVLGNDCNV